jgi:hypothetical protein
MKIAFYSPHLSVRGTEVALYDYARYNEEILGNKSIILYQKNCPLNDATAIEKFKSRFHVEEIEVPFGLQDQSRYNHQIVKYIDPVVEKNKCDVFYIQKGGKNDNVISTSAKNIVLGCSTNPEPHGNRFAVVSKWLSMSSGNLPWVPIIIDLHSTQRNLRNELSIPEDAIVFGRTGGMDTWNIPWASYSIDQALAKRKDIYFVFQNTPKFIEHDRVRFIKTTADPEYKSMFINTCDALIHARQEGESFGQTVAEFSTKNKRVITFFNSPERNHILYLGDKGLYYSNPSQLIEHLVNFESAEGDFNFYKDHTPELGMLKFKEIMLDNL